MYRFSRSIYRDLAPNVIVDPVNSGNGKPRSNTNGHPHANGHVSHNGRVNGNGRANGAHATGAHATGGHVTGGHVTGGHATGGHVTGGHANGNAHPNGGGARNRQQLLDACEAAMRRLAYDRRYFAHPARSLFGEVRMLFPIHEQDRALRVIERNVNLALEHLARLPEQGAGFDGQPSECRAHTRKGTPCQRQPLPGRDYCPSHKHLEESLEPAAEIKLLDERAGEPQDPVSAAT